MKRKKTEWSVVNVGTTSLVMIFAVMALVTFALLAYSSASAQWRLARKMAERTTEYYEAEESAAVRLERLNDWMKQLALEETAMSEQEFELLLAKLPEAERDMEWQDGKICWQVLVGDQQRLEVEVETVPEIRPEGEHALPEEKEQNDQKREEASGWRLIRWQLTGPEGGLKQQTLELYGG